jgi:hypothetical protein
MPRDWWNHIPEGKVVAHDGNYAEMFRMEAERTRQPMRDDLRSKAARRAEPKAIAGDMSVSQASRDENMMDKMLERFVKEHGRRPHQHHDPERANPDNDEIERLVHRTREGYRNGWNMGEIVRRSRLDGTRVNPSTIVVPDKPRAHDRQYVHQRRLGDQEGLRRSDIERTRVHHRGLGTFAFLVNFLGWLCKKEKGSR